MKATRYMAIPALACLVLSGCFTYAPAEFETVPVGSRVRAHLTPTGQSDLESRTGRNHQAISGKVVDRQDNSVVVAVRQVRGGDAGTGMGDLIQHIDVRDDHVSRLDLKILDGTKTALLVGGSIGVVGTLALLALQGDPVSGSGPGTGGGGDESLRFPFLFFEFFLPQ